MELKSRSADVNAMPSCHRASRRSLRVVSILPSGWTFQEAVLHRGDRFGELRDQLTLAVLGGGAAAEERLERGDASTTGAASGQAIGEARRVAREGEGDAFGRGGRGGSSSILHGARGCGAGAGGEGDQEGSGEAESSQYTHGSSLHFSRGDPESPGVTLVADWAGYVNLGCEADYAPGLGCNGLHVTREKMEKDPQEVQAMVRAYIKAVRYCHENVEGTIDVMQRYTSEWGIDGPEIAREAYKWLAPYWNETIDVKVFDRLLNNAADKYDREIEHIDSVLETRFYEEALAQLAKEG